ncbi:hypothetical protein HMPREF9554_01607 [Treponema phagedenis F0421]|nr:hypothetical protein HMPREF9554_01607 [Treponema phagedenis F0421]
MHKNSIIRFFQLVKEIVKKIYNFYNRDKCSGILPVQRFVIKVLLCREASAGGLWM